MSLHDVLSNDDPITKTAELHQWYIAFFLIGTNLAAIIGSVYLYAVGLTGEMVALAFSCVVSMFYHTCQTTTVCFHLGLERWTISDHFTAPLLLAAIAIATVNSYSIDAVMLRFRQAWEVGLDGVVKGEFPEVFARDAALNFKWTAGITWAYIIIVFLSTICHPYSMQHNLIVIAFGLCVILIKIVVIDNGNPENIQRRISVPDLIVGLVLIAISLVYFVLDGFFYYWQFHSLWHTFSYIGVYFYAAGITKGLPGAYSPVGRIREKIAAAARRKRERKHLQARII